MRQSRFEWKTPSFHPNPVILLGFNSFDMVVRHGIALAPKEKSVELLFSGCVIGPLETPAAQGLPGVLKMEWTFRTAVTKDETSGKSTKTDAAASHALLRSSICGMHYSAQPGITNCISIQY